MSNVNYQAPESNLLPESAQSSSVGKWLAIIGSMLLLALPIGLISTIISMVQIFQYISAQGASDATLMAGSISSALVSSALGLVVGLLGAMFLCVSIVFFKHRKPWVFRVALTASFITFLLFPVGTVVAVVILIVLFFKKNSFY